MDYIHSVVYNNWTQNETSTEYLYIIFQDIPSVYTKRLQNSSLNISDV